ncbi:amidase [Amycolatopsis rubida]|uniref:Amidase n=1 Tax=Amycolatopsis rubida TaxID=112413 RepID=A0ABX0BWE1_9PSEU|nr:MULTISPECIES: amidase [Amycolatopsis]MYW92632.1 Asp-tRNA(Asn)/Glu-tRNA(Gln) amidotransferase GatCAB subunit A [Amycolatopsis rubida]NEC57617.1 amidase [Amycolatopsis rubida]OAP26272.1 Glutamyl-tRNA(Gln) amidotransferase subunit A [Amycolatopsis sp. M39]
MSLADLTLAEASAAIREQQVSPTELVEDVLARIDEAEPRLHAYVTVEADRARAEAAALGRVRSPLHGIPMGLKDLIDVAGTATTASSQVRAGHRAERDSAVAAQLKAAGAVLLGKTHTHEFAYGLTTPQTHNARNPSRVAGGSSGGSAVAVAAGAATFALGTDTGGSIRVPAALNGVVGLKPTYGLIPRNGVTSLSWSLDHVGPITRTVEDAALVLSVLSGQSFPVGGDLTGLRVGVPGNYYFDHVDPTVEASVREAVDHLADLGAELVDVEIPLARYLPATHWGLMVPEATAYHERSLRTVPDQYAADVRVLLEAGELMSAGDYLRAQRARTLMRQEWTRLFDKIDVLAAPTVPMTAVPAGQETVTWSDGSVEAVSDAYVRLSAPANVTGVPALTLPIGDDLDGMPIGLQLLARPHGEPVLLRTGHALERTRLKVAR